MSEVRRKPWLAGLLSLFVPGLGQVYNGQGLKGVLFYCLYGIVGLACLVFLFTLSLAPLDIVLPLGIILAGHLYILMDAIKTARHKRATFQPKSYNKWYIYLAILVLAAFVIQPTAASTIRKVCQAFKIPSGAMEETLLIGDHILVDKFRLRFMPLQRFVIIVFHYPWEQERVFIERLIALPGERVQLRNRQVYINEQPLQEPYAQYMAARGQAEPFGPIIVPKRGDTIEIRSDQQLYVNAEPVSIPPGRYYPRDHGDAMTGFAVFYGPLFPVGTTLQKPIGPLVVQDDYYFTLGDNRDNSKDSRYWGFVPHANVLGVAKRIYWSWDRHAKWVRWERIGQDIR
jgi:signal peptidase I